VSCHEAVAPKYDIEGLTYSSATLKIIQEKLSILIIMELRNIMELSKYCGAQKYYGTQK